MPDLCKDYDLKGYCIKGRQCPHHHGDERIELDVSQYTGLLDSMAKTISKSKQEQHDLQRKQTTLLANLVSQQRLLIEKIESCSDEDEKTRLKTALNEMSQKTKDWIEAQSLQTHSNSRNISPTLHSNSQSSSGSRR